MIHVFMMVSVLARPEQYGIFKCAGSENERKQFYDPVSLESDMRKQAVITERDRKTTCKEHHEKKDGLESIDPKEREIRRDRGECEEQCADEK